MKRWTGRAVTQARALVIERDGEACWLRFPGCTGNAGRMTVDHVLPRSSHPELTWSESNWRLACAWCNAMKSDGTPAEGKARALRRLQARAGGGGPRRGGGAEPGAKRRPRPGASGPSGARGGTSVVHRDPVFSTGNGQPRSIPPSRSLVGPTESDRTGSGAGGPDGAELDQADDYALPPDTVGHTEPRLLTPIPAGADTSAGDDAVQHARDVMGLELYPWQELLLRVTLATVDGRLVSDTVLASVARQQGKSVVLQVLVGWWITRRAAVAGPQSVIHAGGNKLVTVEAQWSEVAEKVAEAFPGAVERFYRSSGRKELVLVDGSRYACKSAAAGGSAIHGTTNDLAVLDEVWRLDEEVCDQAVLPTMLTRPDPLRFMVSTAGDRDSVYMRTLRDTLAVEADLGEHTGATLLEWSPPDGITGEAAWPWSCPSLGRGNLTPARLRSFAARMSELDAARALENRWTDQGATVWIRPPAWAAAGAVPLPAPAERPGSTFVAVEAARLTAGDEVARYGIVTAWKGPAELVGVRAREVIGEQPMWDTVAGLASELGAVVLLPPGLYARHPFPDDRTARRTGSQELRATSDEVRALVNAGRVVHDGSDELTASVHNSRRWVPADTGGADLRPGDGTSVHLARAFVWAVGEASRVAVPLPGPVLRLA